LPSVTAEVPPAEEDVEELDEEVDPLSEPQAVIASVSALAAARALNVRTGRRAADDTGEQLSFIGEVCGPPATGGNRSTITR